MKKSQIKAWAIARAKEGSTWRGLALVLSAAGIMVDPVLLQGVASGIIALVGVFEAVKQG